MQDLKTEYLKVLLLRLNVGLPFKSWFSGAELYAISKQVRKALLRPLASLLVIFVKLAL